MPTLKLFGILFDNAFKWYDDTGMFVCLAAFIYYTKRPQNNKHIVYSSMYKTRSFTPSFT